MAGYPAIFSELLEIVGNCDKLFVDLRYHNYEDFQMEYKKLLSMLGVSRVAGLERADDELMVDDRWSTSNQATKTAVIDILRKLENNLKNWLSDKQLRRFLQEIESLKPPDENSSKKVVLNAIGKDTSVEGSRL
jgi:hypothetical protein